MVFKRPLPISPSPSTINEQNISSLQSTFCKVCGDIARINNYGALSCQSCKTFFRRNGFRPEIVRPCQYEGQCEVNILTRRLCTPCRLGKCFLVGMSTDHIRKEIYQNKYKSLSTKSNKTHTSECKTIMPTSQIRVLDLLCNDRSLLSTSDWTLFSNVVHAYDTFSLLPKLHRILKNLSSTPREILYDTVDVLETVGSIFISTQSFISSTPDFQVLTINEQQSLIERNLHGISSLSGIVLYRDAEFFENSKCYDSFISVYGLEMIKQSKCLMKHLDLDSTLIKLLLLIITFSSNCFIVNTHTNMHNDSFLHGTYRLFGSQNVYVELLWKYMIYRYGYYETIIRFSGLVKYVLNNITQAAAIYTNNDLHHDFIDEVSEKTKEKLIINQHEPIVLWGKTLPYD